MERYWHHKDTDSIRLGHATVIGIQWNERGYDGDRIAECLNALSGIPTSDLSRWQPGAVKQMREAMEKAVTAATFVVRICEADMADGQSPSPFRRSTPEATLAQCYGAMSFIGEALTALSAAPLGNSPAREGGEG